MFVPPMFAEKLVDIPAFALFPAEIALVMMLSVLFFENATPTELLRLAFTMLACTMFLGGMGNIYGKTSQTLPDQTLLLNWIQLICMNVGGLVATIAFYQTRTNDSNVISRPQPIREVARKDDDEDDEVSEEDEAAAVAARSKFEVASGESVQEIIGKLDHKRIESLESSLKKPDGDNMSLESLFADESQAATSPKSEIQGNEGGLDNLLSGGNTAVKAKAPPAVDEPKAGWATEVEAGEAPSVEADWSTADSAIPAPPLVENKVVDDVKVEEPPVVEPTPVVEAAKTVDAGGKLFDDVSGDLEDIFADLAQGAANDDLTAEKLAEVKATAPVEEPKVEEPKVDSKLMDVSDDEIDDIFANIVSEDTVADMLEEVAAPAASEQKAPDVVAPKEVKEFGRLSAGATSKTEPVAPGTLKTIGQMLLDTQAVENIIKRSETQGEGRQTTTTARVVSVSRGADIQAMLDKIAEHELIDGCLVIGKDGLLIGATQSLGMMRDVYGVLGLGIHSTTNLGTKKIDMGDLRQSIFRTGDKVTVLTEIGIGVLAAFCDKWDIYRIDGVLDHIGKAIKASEASGGAALPMETLSGGMLAGADAPAVSAPPVVAEPEPVVAEAEPDIDTVVSITEAKGGLLNVGDDDLGDLFDNVLADPKVQHDAIGDKKEEAAPAGGPISVTDDDMADLFDNLLDNKNADVIQDAMDFTPETAKEAPAPAAEEAPAAAAIVEPAKKEETPEPVAPAAKKAEKPAAKEAQQIKEFGRLSSNTSAAAAGQADGAIKAIGRQLIDVQAVENIIKSGEKREKMGHGLTTARVISQARGEGIKALLTKIDGCPGVAGSLIVGNDGLVIASTLTGGLDKDLLGALCNAMHGHTDLAAKKLNMGKTKQVIFHAEDKMTILTAVAVGVLAVFVENHDMGTIDSLLTAIDSTVRG
jgi:predicted regulator of Ras-like GTPase activity (Roadblock/LC7/MglB family)